MRAKMDLRKDLETKTYEDVVKKFYEEFIPEKYDEMPVIPEIRSLWKFEDEVIDKYIPDGSSVLDVGCGTGRHLLFLKRKGCHVVGLDYSREMIKIAERKVKDVEIVLADMRDIPFPDDFFDFSICMFSTIGNVDPGREKAVEEMYRVSRRGIIFSVYNQEAIDKVKNWYLSINLHLEKVHDHTVYLKEGLISHFFEKNEIINMINKLKPKPKDYKIFSTSIGWVVVIFKT